MAWHLALRMIWRRGDDSGPGSRYADRAGCARGCGRWGREMGTTGYAGHTHSLAQVQDSESILCSPSPRRSSTPTCARPLVCARRGHGSALQGIGPSCSGGGHRASRTEGTLWTLSSLRFTHTHARYISMKLQRFEVPPGGPRNPHIQTFCPTSRGT